MKIHFFLFAIMIAFSACKQSPSSEAVVPDSAPAKLSMDEGLKSLSATISSFDEGYTNDDDTKMFAHVSKELKVYGTDPSEIWDYDVFRSHVGKMRENKVPKIHLDTSYTQMSADQLSACVVRQLDWEIFPNKVRQVLYYEREDTQWMLKTLVLGHLIENKR